MESHTFLVKYKTSRFRRKGYTDEHWTAGRVIKIYGAELWSGVRGCYGYHQLGGTRDKHSLPETSPITQLTYNCLLSRALKTKSAYHIRTELKFLNNTPRTPQMLLILAANNTESHQPRVNDVTLTKIPKEILRRRSSCYRS